MPIRGMARLLVSAALLVSAIAAVFWVSDWSALSAAASEIFLPSLALVLLLLLCGVALSSLRLKLITADLGYTLTFRDAAFTLSIGQLAGTAFLQFAGQLLGRGAVLSRRGIPPAATVVISGYERIAAFSVSMLLAAGGALYLFGTLSIDLSSGGVPLIKLGLGLAAVTAAGAFWAWGSAVMDFVRGLTRDMIRRIVRSFLISLIIQGTTLAAYVTLANDLAPSISLASLAAASCIVMLAASLPVSFGGWGLRELSAVVALQAIGLSSASALLVALLIGFLSLTVVAATAVVVMIGWKPGQAVPSSSAASERPDYAAAMDWLLPLAAATAVFFQIHIPTGSGRISVNLADPVVVVGAVLFVLHHVGQGWPQWRIGGVTRWIGATTAVLALAIVHGWTAFGWTDWAFVNKGLGWLMLLCYAATGALIVRRAQDAGFARLLQTFAASGVAIAALDIGLVVLDQLGVDLSPGLVERRVAGLSQNPNAFALMLTLVLAALIVLRANGAAGIAMMATTLVGLWLAGSRAAFIAVPFVLAAAVLAGAAPRPILKSVAAACLFIFGVAVLQSELQAVTGVAAAGGGVVNVFERTDVVTAQHIQTIYEGLAMFMAQPLFGAGLGAYIHDQATTVGTPLVIHSTAVWLLAETGLVGFAVFAAAALRLLAEAVWRRAEPAALMLLLTLCAFGVISMAHEMLYQRAVWLLLGAMLAAPVLAASPAMGRRPVSAATV
ncbi:MAG: flippase-like domain-containing protein [Xanthobacteraceae bacterium]|nr:flippase-like domain-containing protein [Xanthobacteraceae bacterium]